MPGHRKRRQFKQTDAFTRGMVIGLKRAGWSIRQIAADTHLGASTVHRLWRRWLEQGNVAIYRNVGATRVTSARVNRRILRQAVAAPQATCTAILQHVQDTLDHSISTRTISRRLVANGLHSCRPLRRLPLTHRIAANVWNGAGLHRRGLRNGTGSCSQMSRVSACPVIVAVYACGVDVEKGPIRQQLWNAPPCDNGVPNALYQQDNARPHTARISQQALQDVQMLPWPPYSPDLSPIEHVWDIIGRRLHALPQPRSEDELWQMVEREWRAIPQDAIRTLIDSLPRRVAACIAVRDLCGRALSSIRRRFFLISTDTIHRMLHMKDLYARRPIICVPLTPTRKRARKLWCRQHAAWNPDEWRRVMFTDESRFSLNSDSRRVFVWREVGTRNNPRIWLTGILTEAKVLWSGLESS
ncbi:hypothetical protein LAZ67_9002717 [Cordylochernes scorpioides]|uniref:Transposase n=1 Tax=Cordylochernes scorpioides TaxID=51811 RepID=A0ABY6KW09_9ARAC|nr:hypothetical protein LAZ67_9002717 [Cordylochernes scorpioides]